MPIQDNADAARRIRNLDVATLRRDLDAWLQREVGNRNPEDIPFVEMKRIFEKISPDVDSKYGVDVWDAMVLLKASQDADVGSPEAFEDWSRLYELLGELVASVRAEATLQEDYDGTNSFRVWCAAADCTLLAEALRAVPVSFAHPLIVMIAEVEGERLTGREYSVHLGASSQRDS